MSPTFKNKTLKIPFLMFIEEWKNKEIIHVNSSGSTNVSKKISLTKNQMILSATKTIDFFKFKSGIKALLCLSLETIAGKMMVVRAIVGNWNLTVCNPESNPLTDIYEDFDFAAMVPIQIQKILEDNPEKLKRIKTIIVGGAPISDELAEKLKLHEITVYQTFGMTETVSHIALRKIGKFSENSYTTLDGITVSDNKGRLVINYPEMFKTELITNDIVNVISSKKFEWLGRADFIINSGGIKLNPEMIENKLSGLFHFPFFLTGITDEKLGTKLALVIEKQQSLNISKNEMKIIVEKYEIPKVYVILNSFILTESGKINRTQTLKKIKPNDWKEIL